jgi:glycosyltransferase involved in cell wall biosynthesis
LKIAQIAPLEEAVPPVCYGGTERVIAYLTEALIDLGHDVTLFASGDSRTRARLVATVPRAMRLESAVDDAPTAASLTRLNCQLEAVAAHAAEFDIIHSHTDYHGFSMLRRLGLPSVSTLHGRLDRPELAPHFAPHHRVHWVSISDAQRRLAPYADFAATVLHGLPETLLRLGDGAGGHLAFLGRASREKGPCAAIRIANAAGRGLMMAAKIGAGDRDYYRAAVAPLIDAGRATFVGEIRERDKQQFLGNAAALLFPISWPEPFGLVMIEAMACGTPVIAFDHGSVREIIEDGVTGFIVRDEAEAVRAVSRLGMLDRRHIRAEFERRFTARRMAQDYIALYARLCQQPRSAAAVAAPGATAMFTAAIRTGSGSARCPVGA